ncbi:MAG: hypothetical protein SNJ56_04720, partial [Termitinemataceae bacterium]
KASQTESQTAHNNLAEIDRLVQLSEEMNKDTQMIEQIYRQVNGNLESLTSIVTRMAELNRNMIQGMNHIMDLFTDLGSSYASTFAAIESLDKAVAPYKV